MFHSEEFLNLKLIILEIKNKIFILNLLMERKKKRLIFYLETK